MAASVEIPWGPPLFRSSEDASDFGDFPLPFDSNVIEKELSLLKRLKLRGLGLHFDPNTDPVKDPRVP